MLIWTIGGGINLIDRWWAGFEYPALISGIIVIFSLTLITSILNLPFSLYHTFVIEERFGFNQTTLKIWLLDLIKATVLVVLLGAPLLAVILWLMNQAGENWWIYAWLVWMGFSLDDDLGLSGLHRAHCSTSSVQLEDTCRCAPESKICC